VLAGIVRSHQLLRPGISSGWRRNHV